MMVLYNRMSDLKPKLSNIFSLKKCVVFLGNELIVFRLEGITISIRLFFVRNYRTKRTWSSLSFRKLLWRFVGILLFFSYENYNMKLKNVCRRWKKKKRLSNYSGLQSTPHPRLRGALDAANVIIPVCSRPLALAFEGVLTQPIFMREVQKFWICETVPNFDTKAV